MGESRDPEKADRFESRVRDATEKHEHGASKSSLTGRSTSHSSSSESIGRASEESIAMEPLDHVITPALEDVTQIQTATSIGSSGPRVPEFEVDFGDSDNPREWPFWFRAWTIFVISFSTWIAVLYSTTYTASIPGLIEEFHVESETVATLGVTTYLIGLGLGSLVWAPVSELYGRRPVYLCCMVIFTLLIIPSCLATSLTEILVVRFFGYVGSPFCPPKRILIAHLF